MWNKYQTKIPKSVQNWHSKSMIVSLKETKITIAWADPEDSESEAELKTVDIHVNEPVVDEQQARVILPQPDLDQPNNHNEAKELEVEELMHVAPVFCETEETQAMESGLTETVEMSSPNLPETTIVQNVSQLMPIADFRPAGLATESTDVIENSESLNKRFLAALKGAAETYGDDKRFAKIMRKMEKGKSLKKKESSLVYFLLREKGQCP